MTISVTYYGTDSIGGSIELLSQGMGRYQQVTLPDGFLLTIDAYVTSKVPGTEPTPWAALMSDAAGSPGVILAYCTAAQAAVGAPIAWHPTGAERQRWFRFPIGRAVTSGTYWLAVGVRYGEFYLAYTSGADKQASLASGHPLTDGSLLTLSDSGRKYSIRTPVLTGRTITTLGYETAGASTEVWTAERILFRQVTVAARSVLANVAVRARSSAAQIADLGVALYEDATGAPGRVLSVASPDDNCLALDTTYRWLSMPLGRIVDAGTYWLAASSTQTGDLDISYDSGGTDVYATLSYIGDPATPPSFWDGNDSTRLSLTTSTRNYNIRAETFAP